MTRMFWIAVTVLLAAPPLWAAEEKAMFEDRFDGKLGEGWSWLRENPPAHRFADGALEIRVEPGDAQSVKNALVRAAPDRRAGRTAIEVTVTFTAPPTKQYEQAGITWYRGGQPVFKLVHEQIDGKTYIIPGKVPAPEKTVQLRLVVTADKFTAQFRPDAKGEFKTVAEGDLAPGPDEKVSLQCYQGPADAEHWIRFDDFRIVQLADGAAAAPDAAKPAAPPALGDKTLVVWAAPANLEQRGGSALTIDDLASHFDGIVFGELAAKRWTAGSDFLRRTHKEPGAWPAETADAATLVQVAIAYQGKEIAIYRNGERYAAYTMESPPQPFGPHSVVVIGKRHLDQGDDARFAGSVADARIYDRALTADQVAALKPREPSDPKPWAWWTFEGPEPKERTGRFAVTRLVGGAKVEGGRLVLDGRTGTLLAARDAQDYAGIVGVEPADIEAARRMREHLLADPHRPVYHFVIPEGYGMPFDPNGAIFWKGRYHLFYIFQDPRGHNWGHASSADLLHWRHHPTGLVGGMFSGNAFLNKEGRPTMCYHQVGQGNAMAVALDDDLNTWEKLASNPITPKTEKGDPHHDAYRSWDPYGWLEGDTYYAIFGGERPGVVKAPTLGGPWRYVGDLMGGPVEGVGIREDVSCADFFQLGDKRMLLCISHRLGARYYLGQWKNEQFFPEFHERMSWVDNAYFAPESLLDGRGRRIMWAWIFDGRSERARRASGWSGTMSLPRVLALGHDGRLRMSPVEELERLRGPAQSVENVALDDGKDVPIEKVAGNTLELLVEIDPGGAKQCGVKVCRAPDGAEETLVYYDAAAKKLAIDATHASLGEGPKNVEAGPFELGAGETLTLRVFVDRSVVEVFANDRQAAMRRIYPTRADSTGVALFARGGAAKVRRVTAWPMAPSNPF